MEKRSGAGRPKTLAGKLTNFNSKVQEEHKRQLDAIIKVGPYSSVREMLEDWTNDYFKDHPEIAKRVEDYLALTKEL